MRTNALFALLLCNLILMGGFIYSINRVINLTNDLQAIRTNAVSQTAALRIGCEKGNVQRKWIVFGLTVQKNMARFVAQNAPDPMFRQYFSSVVPILDKGISSPALSQRECKAEYPNPSG